MPLRRPSIQTRLEEKVSGSLLALFFLALTLGPRFPLAVDVGRRADLRIHEILLVFFLVIVSFSIKQTRKITNLRSPWSPFLSVSLACLIATLILKLLLSDGNTLRQLGYSYRAVVFFVITFLIGYLAWKAGTYLGTFVIFGILISFSINVAHVISNGLRGSNATMANNEGLLVQLYSPGLLGEPNALSAGIYFVFTLSFFTIWLALKDSFKTWTLLGVMLSLASIFVIDNRSAMVMAGFVLIIGALMAFKRKNLVALAFQGVIFIGAVIFFFFLSSRGASEDVGTAITQGRLPQWQRSLTLLRQSTVLGWDLGTNEAHQSFLRLWGDWGAISAISLLLLFAVIIVRKPKPHIATTPGNIQWLVLLKLFLTSLLVGGLLTDSLTPVLSWDLLAFSVGIAWGTWPRDTSVDAINDKVSHPE